MTANLSNRSIKMGRVSLQLSIKYLLRGETLVSLWHQTDTHYQQPTNQHARLCPSHRPSAHKASRLMLTLIAVGFWGSWFGRKGTLKKKKGRGCIRLDFEQMCSCGWEKELFLVGSAHSLHWSLKQSLMETIWKWILNAGFKRRGQTSWSHDHNVSVSLPRTYYQP